MAHGCSQPVLVSKLQNDYPRFRGDRLEQGTSYLLFLKMAAGRSRPPYKLASLIPAQYAWPSLLARDGDELFDHYRHTAEALDNQNGLP